mmetsp:Transcript_1155/g.3848  ORF Transcript_1155/g.3848 Transcript_1155/m.3848 type:complete len:154 (+) Transcript_1155:48-509(+)
MTLPSMWLALVLAPWMCAPSLAEGANSTAFMAPRSDPSIVEPVELEVDPARLTAEEPQCEGFDLSRCGAWVQEHLPEGWRGNVTAEEAACCKAQFKNVARDLPWWAWPLIVLGAVACGLCLTGCILKLGLDLLKAILCCPFRCCCRCRCGKRK